MSEPSFSPKLVRPEGDSSSETLAADDMESVRRLQEGFKEIKQQRYRITGVQLAGEVGETHDVEQRVTAGRNLDVQDLADTHGILRVV